MTKNHWLAEKQQRENDIDALINVLSVMKLAQQKEQLRRVVRDLLTKVIEEKKND